MSVPPPGAHGGDVEAVARALGVAPADVLDLSASLNPFAPDVEAIAADAVRSGALRRYPDTEAARTALAAAIGVAPETLVLTNGGAEAIALVAALHPEGWVEDPEFSLYRRHLRVIRPDAPRWRSNPHNPLGTLADDADQAFVWDEAFFPLATGRWSRGDASAWRIGSLTKLWACAGLRLGYVLAPTTDDAARVTAQQPRWAVNGLALAMVEPLLALTDLATWAGTVARQRAQLVTLLSGHGFVVVAGDANWVLVPGMAPLRDGLAAHGVLVRDCASFGMSGVARVAVPDDRGLERLDEALRAVRRGGTSP